MIKSYIVFVYDCIINDNKWYHIYLTTDEAFHQNSKSAQLCNVASIQKFLLLSSVYASLLLYHRRLSAKNFYSKAASLLNSHAKSENIDYNFNALLDYLHKTMKYLSWQRICPFVQRPKRVVHHWVLSAKNKVPYSTVLVWNCLYFSQYSV